MSKSFKVLCYVEIRNMIIGNQLCRLLSWIFPHIFFFNVFNVVWNINVTLQTAEFISMGYWKRGITPFFISVPWCNTMNISAAIEVSFKKKKWQYQRRYYMICIIVISMWINIFVYVAFNKNVIFSCSWYILFECFNILTWVCLFCTMKR